MASESGTPKDMEDFKRMTAQKKSLKNQTVKVYKLLGKKQDLLPWKDIVQEIPNVVEAIEKIEAKKPKSKFISPSVNEPTDNEPYVVPSEGGKIDMAADHGSPLSCPWFKEKWEIFEWYCQNDPEKFNIEDLIWIDSFYDSTLYEACYREESGQNCLERLFSKRLIKPEASEDGMPICQGITKDAAVENRWRRIKRAIIVDQISGLSHPDHDEEPVFKDEWNWFRYGFYRGIEKRFPGTLNEADWEEVKKYEAGDGWKFHYSECRNPRLRRALADS